MAEGEEVLGWEDRHREKRVGVVGALVVKKV